MGSIRLTAQEGCSSPEGPPAPQGTHVCSREREGVIEGRSALLAGCCPKEDRRAQVQDQGHLGTRKAEVGWIERPVCVYRGVRYPVGLVVGMEELPWRAGQDKDGS